jgi:hypothetical protein
MDQGTRNQKDSLLMSQTQRFGEGLTLASRLSDPNYATSPGAMISAHPNLLTRVNQSRGQAYGHNKYSMPMTANRTIPPF